MLAFYEPTPPAAEHVLCMLALLYYISCHDTSMFTNTLLVVAFTTSAYDDTTIAACGVSTSFLASAFSNSNHLFHLPLRTGARCSSVVRAFAHGAMGHRFDPSLSYFSFQPVVLI